MATSSELEIRLDWSEMDHHFGHINNVQFFKYIQAARVHFWEQIGLNNQLYQATGVAAILAKTSCDFLLELKFPGFIHIVSTLSSIGNTSFQIQHNIYNAAKQLAAQGNDIIVLYNYKLEQKVLVKDYFPELEV